MSTIAATNSLFEIDAELDSLLDEIEEQTAQGGEPRRGTRRPLPAILLGTRRKGGPDRALSAPDGGARTVLPSRGCPARRPGPRRSRQGGANQEHGPLLPDEPRPQERSRDASSPCAPRRTARTPCGSPTKPRYQLAYRKIDARIGGVLWETVLANLPEELSRCWRAAVQESKPDSEAIKSAIQHEEHVPGAELRRGCHLRVG